MKNLVFRSPTAEEIECKAIVDNNTINIILYCRAETCTNILNETVGNMGWEKEYTNNNRNCIVRIWDEETQRMVSKEDCGGGPTDIDGLKGQASNGFKRVCALGWGLGIELYSQPKITLPVTDDNSTVDKMGNNVPTEDYFVDEIEFENKKITKLVVKDGDGNIVYPKQEKPAVTNETQIQEEIPNDFLTEEDFNELPDNTDGFEEPEEDRFEKYASIIESEIKRTHVRKTDVLKSLKIDNLDRIDEADEDLIKSTIERLKGFDTYIKKVL